MKRWLWGLLVAAWCFSIALGSCGLALANASVTDLDALGAREAFADTPWVNYEWVALAYDEEEAQPPFAFVLLRKDAHNVLCLLKWSEAAQVYTLAWANDKAVYQGNRAPRFIVQGYEALDYEYPSEQSKAGELATERYTFAQSEHGEWYFYTAERRSGDARNLDADINVLTVEWAGGSLELYRNTYSSQGRPITQEGPLAEVPIDDADYELDAFDLTRYNADFEALASQIKGEDTEALVSQTEEEDLEALIDQIKVEDSEALERQAHEAWEDDDSALAKAFCLKALALEPKSAWAYAFMAEMYNYTGFFDHAEDVLEKGFEQGAQSADMYYQRAYARWGIWDLSDAYEPTEALADLDQAIALDPSKPEYFSLQDQLFTEMGRYDDANVAKDMLALLDTPNDPKLLFSLSYHLDMVGRNEEALQPYIRWLSAQPGLSSQADALSRAEAHYTKGAYDEAAPSYARVSGEEYLPVGAVMHVIDTLVQLSRYEEALALLEADIGGIEAWYIDKVLRGDVYFAMGDVHQARYWYEFASAESSEYSSYLAPILDQRFAALDAYLPDGVRAFFTYGHWSSYLPVKAAYFDEARQPSTVFVFLRKGDHNVLCLLTWSNTKQGYTLVWENDKAVYQGDQIPRMSYDGHDTGMLRYEYPNESAPKGAPNAEEYLFVCDEDTGEWRFVRAAHRYLDGQDAYADIRKLTMTAADDQLKLLWMYSDYRESYVDEDEEPVAYAPFDAETYALRTFDIERCNTDLEALIRQSKE